MSLNPPNGMKNMTLWFSYDKNGVVDKLTNIKAIDPKLDLEVELMKMTKKSEYRNAGVYAFKKERIVTPSHFLNGSDNVGIIMYYRGKRHRAILPYYVAITEL